ncbi:MAG: choice-of-anchor D domain-containing protein, partial [Alphaproteobacteria bacterium]|nr:choice-of-anchor D domain-containing protein [Alphaproteobacteria bacterium]
MTTAGGPINLLSPEASPNTSMSVGINVATAGAKSGTVQVNFATDGTGTSGLPTASLPSQTINVSGNVYRLGTGSAAPTTVDLGNFRLGGAAPVAQNVQVSNTAANDGFSESVGIQSITPTGAFNVTNTLGATRVAAGAAPVNALNVALGAGAVAGVNNGNVAVQYLSDGAGTSGLGTIASNSQNVALKATGFNAASANTLGNVVFANRHVGTAASQALSISNTAPTGSFTEKLNASFGTVTGTGVTTAGGPINLLSPEASPNTSMSVGIDVATRGAKTGTVQVNFATDGMGTSGLAAASLASQTINVSGNVYALASAAIENAGTVLNFGSVLRNSVQTRTLAITNVGTSGDGFQEGLDASFGTVTGAGAAKFATAGSISNLAAGVKNDTAMTVTLNTTDTGVFSASVPVIFVSNGTLSGLTNTALGTTNLAAAATVTLTVGDLAIAGLDPTNVNFGKFRAGAANQTQALTVSNLLGGPGEGLNATFGATTGTATTNSGSITSLAPGGTNSAAMSVTLGGLATAGAKSGSVAVNFESDGTFNGGVKTPLPSQTVNLSAEVYRLAEASVTPAVNLAARRVGEAAASANVSIANTAATDGFSEGLKGTIGAAPAPFNVSGPADTGLIAAGGSVNRTVSLSTATAGNFAGNLAVGLVSNGDGTSGFGDAALAGANVALSGKVYEAAKANLSQTSINFGLRRVGDAVAAVAIDVTNGASGALTDSLKASGGPSAPSPFTTSGPASGALTTTGLAGGATQSGAYAFGMNTGAAGNFSGNATFGLISTNPDMADLSLTGTVALEGVVNNYAKIGIAKQSGGGTASATT